MQLFNNLETIPCPLCGKNNFKIKYPAHLKPITNDFDYLTETANHFQIVLCNYCHMIYSSPIFNEQTLIDLYKNCRINKTVTQDVIDSIEINLRRYVDHLVRYSSIVRGNWLDIGCGSGNLLSYARDKGYKVFGIDPSEKAIAYAKSTLQLNQLTAGTYQKESYPAESFDLITLIHVIDHVRYPNETISNIYFHLKRGGYALIATHDIDSLLSHILGRHFIAYSVQHVSYFSPRTLIKMIEQNQLTHIKTLKTLTTYAMDHLIENGIQHPFLSKHLRRWFHLLRLGTIKISFPFGNFEVIVKKQ